MGHYASEMSGPYTGPTNEQQSEELVAGLADRWALGLRLFDSAHEGRSKWTCPQCFIDVDFLLMKKHDEYHANQFKWMRHISRSAALDTTY